MMTREQKRIYIARLADLGCIDADQMVSDAETDEEMSDYIESLLTREEMNENLSRTEA